MVKCKGQKGGMEPAERKSENRYPTNKLLGLKEIAEGIMNDTSLSYDEKMRDIHKIKLRIVKQMIKAKDKHNTEQNKPYHL